jgi:hypothetical protein
MEGEVKFTTNILPHRILLMPTADQSSNRGDFSFENELVLQGVWVPQFRTSQRKTHARDRVEAMPNLD